MSDPLSEALEALRSLTNDVEHLWQQDVTEERGLLARLDARPACVRTPDFITEAGFGSGWYYPDSPSEGGTK